MNAYTGAKEALENERRAWEAMVRTAKTDGMREAAAIAEKKPSYGGWAIASLIRKRAAEIEKGSA